MPGEKNNNLQKPEASEEESGLKKRDFERVDTTANSVIKRGSDPGVIKKDEPKPGKQ